MKNQFFNIAAIEINKLSESATKNITELQTLQTVKDVTDKWYFRNYMTKDAQRKSWNVADLIIYVTQRINKETLKKIAALKSQLQTVSDATRIITSISVSVEWSKNRTWGNCPQAEIRVCFNDNTCDNYKSGRITGCGFDKESTAIANALNQCNELLNTLYAKRNSNIKKENREIFGYGSGYGTKPYFEGGVGVSCYPAIFQSVGYKWEEISHGKAFDVYSVALLKK